MSSGDRAAAKLHAKARVEVAVQVATRWIIAKLRKQQFCSLAEANAVIAVEVAALNARVTRHLGDVPVSVELRAEDAARGERY